MASVSVSEKDFQALHSAANQALEAGDQDLALQLDKLARKVNASLTYQRAPNIPGMPKPKKPSWDDMPSTLI